MSKDRAYCDRCQWDGKWRTKEEDARADLLRHIEKKHPRMNAQKRTKDAKIVGTVDFINTFRVPVVAPKK